MLTNKKIGFLGGGNMAEAMIKGMLSAGFVGSCASILDLRWVVVSSGSAGVQSAETRSSVVRTDVWECVVCWLSVPW